MKKLKYSFEQKKIASTNLALGMSELEAATALIEKQLYRESVVHLYYSCYYIAQSLLAGQLKKAPSHKSVETELHRVYGKNKDFPRRYVKLHSYLHNLRNKFTYRSFYIPSPKELKLKLKILQYYLKFVLKSVPKIEIDEIISNIYNNNKDLIRDLSFDIYCPKTYSHHTRITFWMPPFYLDLVSPKKLAVQSHKLLKSLRVKRFGDYVVGLNSRLNQYKPIHLVMLDIDTINPEIESALKDFKGILLKTGRGFHFIGNTILQSHTEWEKMMRKFKNDKSLTPHLDLNHIGISLQRGYATLRITESPVKPNTPFFYKELK